MNIVIQPLFLFFLTTCFLSRAGENNTNDISHSCFAHLLQQGTIPPTNAPLIALYAKRNIKTLLLKKELYDECEEVALYTGFLVTPIEEKSFNIQKKYHSLFIIYDDQRFNQNQFIACLNSVKNSSCKLIFYETSLNCLFRYPQKLDDLVDLLKCVDEVVVKQSNTIDQDELLCLDWFRHPSFTLNIKTKAKITIIGSEEGNKNITSFSFDSHHYFALPKKLFPSATIYYNRPIIKALDIRKSIDRYCLHYALDEFCKGQEGTDENSDLSLFWFLKNLACGETTIPRYWDEKINFLQWYLLNNGPYWEIFKGSPYYPWQTNYKKEDLQYDQIRDVIKRLANAVKTEDLSNMQKECIIGQQRDQVSFANEWNDFIRKFVEAKKQFRLNQIYRMILSFITNHKTTVKVIGVIIAFTNFLIIIRIIRRTKIS